ncbi:MULTISPECIES: HNH endonuclease signature motif containing protein [unclassified Phaeobacter]|uniref:HNH endonuclease signature motif containing protein n=1 Tax=unclassified Phaeobacter TaxID=2621772 RepID=UPI003A8A53FA
MMGEVWKIPESAPQYLVSSEGRIMVKPYSARMPRGGKRQYGGQPHFGVWNKQDCRFIAVYKGKTFKVHRLVCEAFHGPSPSEKSVVMHLDENPANNRPDNLAWGTQKENLNAPGFKKYRETRDLGATLAHRHEDYRGPDL